LWPTQAYWSNNLKVQSILAFVTYQKNGVIEEGDFVTFRISHSEGNRIAAVIWDNVSV
jgi:hypothetical protein